MNESRAKMILALSILGSALLLGACGGGPPTDAPEQEASSDGVPTLTPDSTTSIPIAPGEGQQTYRFKLGSKPEYAAVHRYLGLLYDGDLESLHENFTDEMRVTMTLARLQQLHQDMVDRFGREVEVINEDYQINQDYRGFVRWAWFDGFDGVVQIQWTLRRDTDEVAGLFLKVAEIPPDRLEQFKQEREARRQAAADD